MNLSALSVVMNHDPCPELKLLREENIKLMKSIKVTVDDLKKREALYSNLLTMSYNWGNKAKMNEIQDEIGTETYIEEVDKFCEWGLWYQGFNEGLLSTTQLYKDLLDYDDSVISVEQKWANFPDKYTGTPIYDELPDSDDDDDDE